jgi:hypothetical protein
MHSPQARQVLRAGPAPPKYGSSTRSPAVVPKKTPTGVGWKLSETPISSATCFITLSAGVRSGFSTTPSMRLAWSKCGESSVRQSVMWLQAGSR